VVGYYAINRKVANNSNLSIVSNPGISQLYNATKFSGRNKKKLGIGVFNALVAPTTATVLDKLSIPIAFVMGITQFSTYSGAQTIAGSLDYFYSFTPPHAILMEKPTFKGRTYNGMKVEGLLPNSRMVQGIFDDLNDSTRSLWAYPDTKVWDADRNTNEFVKAMSEWRNHGLLAFTLNLQGGSPYGYSNKQPWHNSAIEQYWFIAKGIYDALEENFESS